MVMAAAVKMESPLSILLILKNIPQIQLIYTKLQFLNIYNAYMYHLLYFDNFVMDKILFFLQFSGAICGFKNSCFKKDAKFLLPFPRNFLKPNFSSICEYYNINPNKIICFLFDAELIL